MKISGMICEPFREKSFDKNPKSNDILSAIFLLKPKDKFDNKSVFE